MKRVVLVSLALGSAIPLLFLSDERNRRQFPTMVRNASSGHPLAKDVRFSVPFVPDPTPTPQVFPPYPEDIVWGEEVSLRLEDLGAGYWQSASVNLWSGSILEGDKANLGHLRFKLNPPDDPLHPGHAVLALPGEWHLVRFAPLAAQEWATRTDFSKMAWQQVAPAEVPALWGLEAGKAFVVRIDLKAPEMPPPVAVATLTATASTMSATPEPRKTQPKRLLAKVFLRKLSLDNVRFDYVLQTNGTWKIPQRDPRSFTQSARPPARRGMWAWWASESVGSSWSGATVPSGAASSFMPWKAKGTNVSCLGARTSAAAECWS
ncbi:MAG: hypothetical protein VKO21_01280 [Candidatus Sericytochromatia bacterium]|nr:hypothetical protein [Candidatus Sericytochromatia bacterium]